MGGLANTTAMCPPGDRSMYHSISYGYLMAEVVRRTDPEHRSYGQFFREVICAPLDIKDLWFGLPIEDEPRVAKFTWGAVSPSAPQVAPNPIRVAMMPAVMAPSPAIWNTREIHASCIPAGSGITTARDGARFFALLANRGELGGTRLISEERLMAQTEPRPNPLQVDEGIGMITTNGIGGYWVGGTHPHTDPVVGRAPHTVARAVRWDGPVSTPASA